MDMLDDLLIRRRRGGLSEAEERRLRSGLRASPEHELSLLAGDAFERAGAPLPGDEEVLQRIVAGALPRGSGARRSWRSPRLPLWVAAPLFLAAAAAASVGGYRALRAEPAPLSAPSGQAPRVVAWPREAHAGVEAHAPELAPPNAALEPAPTTASKLESPAAPAAARPLPLEPDRPSRTSPRASRRERSLARAARPDERAHASAPVPLQPTRPMLATSTDLETSSATELFRRANAARRTDWSAAAALYAELVERHPRSTEAGVAEVALGKWSLALGRGGDALEWFRAHQRRGTGPLAAEALWGEARALESIGSATAARGSWQRLLESYPDSPYARVARERLAP